MSRPSGTVRAVCASRGPARIPRTVRGTLADPHPTRGRRGEQRIQRHGTSRLLSAGALADTLETLVDTLSPFGNEAEPICSWLLVHKPDGGKLQQLGRLYSHYRNLCRAAKVGDTRDLNAAILRLLNGERKDWPYLLKTLEGSIVFRSIRWLNPFEETLISVLKTRLGDARVKVTNRASARACRENAGPACLANSSGRHDGAAKNGRDGLRISRTRLKVADPNLAIDSANGSIFHARSDDTAKSRIWRGESDGKWINRGCGGSNCPCGSPYR